ncbi:unnamed protein product [marine sediment metagenome]|uniref:Carbohydrate kinase FGGY N-terminal domain-containing protein n=1 Tax=marine sediment metagenome TaxID=412755 RepID=X1K193_9ZZZZ
MESKYLLGIDIGTHASKGVLIDLNGKVIATSSIIFLFINLISLPQNLL